MDERRGRGLGRALEAFANAVLERTLPRVRQWLAARLGPRAELAALELDGARVHLIGARIPLGPRAMLHASRVTFATRAEDLALGLPPISLERLEGRVDVHGDLSVGVSVEGAPARAADEWVAGTVRLRDLRIAGRAYEGTAEVWLTSSRFGVEGARLTGAGTELRVEAGGAFDGGDLRVTHARVEAEGTPLAAFVEAIGALRGARPPALPLSPDVGVHGRCELREDGSLSADLRAIDGEARAELSLEGRVVDHEGALWGVARGSIAPSLVAGARASLEGPPIELEGALRGTLARPRAELEARGPELALRVAESELRASRLRATASLDADRGLVLDARARIDRGRLSVQVRDGETRLTLERAAVAPLLALLPPRAEPLVRALALAEGQLWADVRLDGDAAEGAAHLESPRASVTLEPLRLRRRDRAIEASTLRASIDPIGLPIAGVIDLELEIERAAASDPTIARGELRSRALSVTLGARPPAELRDVSARVLVEAGELHLVDARASAFGGAARGTATFSMGGGVIVRELSLDRMDDALVRWALSGGAGLMRGAVVSGALAREAGALRGTLRADTAASALSLSAVIADDGALAGGALEGTLGLADLEPLFERWTFVPAHATWRIAGALGGTLAAPRLDLEARCDRQPVLVSTADGAIELVAEDARVRARATRERIAWSEAFARAYGGALRSRGSVAFAGAASARLELDDARAEALPLARGHVGAYLAGALSGTLDLWRPRSGATVGCGRLRVLEPEYPLLSRAAAALAERFSLPLPARRGTDPLAASVRLGPEGLRFSSIDARVPELRVRGRVDVRRDRTLEGTLRVAPEASWLGASALLAPLAALIDEVPVRVAGTLSAPRLRAGAIEAADGALARSPLGRRVRALLDELAPSAPSRAGGGARHGTASLLTTDALLDRLARDPEDAAELFEALVERGLAADEIAAGVAKRR